MKKLKGIVISGPTGVGKTNMSIILSQKIGAEIISADASQIYKKMNIGTAKITDEEKQGIKHYLIDIVDPAEDFSVGDFEKQVNKILKEKEKKEEPIVLVGGTGLYIKSITDGFSELPSKDEKLREKLNNKPLEELKGILKKIDKNSYDEIDLNNKIRIVRALEVCILTGEKYSDLKRKNIKGNNYDFLKIFLIRNREELYERINKRVDIMIEEGLLEEVYKIYKEYNNSLYKITSIGYKELFKYFDGEDTLENAVENIKKESRRYAKRQITWFRKEEGYNIFDLSKESEDEILEKIIKIWNKY